MSALPTPIVEVAFTGTDTSPVWTDISAYVLTMSTVRGRMRETDKFNAGTATIGLKNDDRRFDPENAAGPYYGNLLPMRPIRIRATWNGITYNVFRGHVDQWPQTYEIPSIGRTEITATDGFKKKQRILLPYPYDFQVGALTPTHWWKLGDAANATAPVDSAASGNLAGQTLGAGAAFGTTAFMPGSGTTSVTFSGFGSAVVLPTAALPQLASFSVELWFQIPNGQAQPANPGNSGSGMLLNLGQSSASPEIQVYIGPANQLNAFLFFGAFPDAGFTSAGAVNDGKPHQVIVAVDGPNHKYTVYLDGVLMGTETPSSFVATAPYFAGLYGWIGNRVGADMAYNGLMQDVVFYDGTILTAAQVTNLYNSGANGFSGDKTGTRLGRLLDYAGWPASLRAVDTGVQSCQGMPISQANTSVLDAERTLEDTEGGALYMSADGKVVFRSRWGPMADARSVTSQATFGDAAGEIPYKDIRFSFDDTLLRNQVTGTRTGGVQQTANDTASQATYGIVGYQRPTTLEADDASVLYACQFQVVEHKDVQTRVAALVINGEASANGKTPNDIYPQSLGRDIGDRVTVKRRPQNAGAAIVKDVHIEGVSHQADASSWLTTFNLSPVPGNGTPYLVLDDANLGKLGSNRLGL